MTIPFSDVNLVAVLGATVACMALGFFWYSPSVFGTQWMKLSKIDPSKTSKSDMKSAMIKGLIATVVANYFLAVVLLLLGVSAVSNGLVVAALLWLATLLPAELHGIAWEKRPVQLVYINGGNTLVTYLLGAAVLLWLS